MLEKIVDVFNDVKVKLLIKSVKTQLADVITKLNEILVKENVLKESHSRFTLLNLEELACEKENIDLIKDIIKTIEN